jgi:hypothetical protein
MDAQMPEEGPGKICVPFNSPMKYGMKPSEIGEIESESLSWTV